MNFAFEAAPESCDCRNVKRKPKKARKGDVIQVAHSVMQDVIAISEGRVKKQKTAKRKR